MHQMATSSSRATPRRSSVRCFTRRRRRSFEHLADPVLPFLVAERRPPLGQRVLVVVPPHGGGRRFPRFLVGVCALHSVPRPVAGATSCAAVALARVLCDDAVRARAARVDRPAARGQEAVAGHAAAARRRARDVVGLVDHDPFNHQGENRAAVRAQHKPGAPRPPFGGARERRSARLALDHAELAREAERAAQAVAQDLARAVARPPVARLGPRRILRSVELGRRDAAPYMQRTGRGGGRGKWSTKKRRAKRRRAGARGGRRGGGGGAGRGALPEVVHIRVLMVAAIASLTPGSFRCI